MSQTRQVFFNHVVLKGSPYEIGRNQAEIIKNIPELVGFLRSGSGKLSEEKYKNISSQMERFCPGIIAEIQGLADGLGIPQQDLVYYSFSYLHKGKCSHFALLPSLTKENVPLIGRSYEFGLETEDMRLCTMQVNGKYSFIGSSVVFFGFTEGMNEHGLVVTMSAGGLPVGAVPGMRPPIEDGFQFWFVIRSVLERCKNVDEALELIKESPTCGNPNLIVADRSGAAALIEVFGAHKAVKRIDAQSAEQFVCSTNHFTLPEMLPYRDPIWKNSQVRLNAIQSWLEKSRPIDSLAMQSLLSREYPQGLACHYYQEYFGTLRSMIFNPVSGTVEICFGSPVVNPWYKIDPTTPAKSYSIQISNQKMPPDFMAPVVE